MGLGGTETLVNITILFYMGTTAILFYMKNMGTIAHNFITKMFFL